MPKVVLTTFFLFRKSRYNITMKSSLPPASEWEKPNRSDRLVRLIVILFLTALVIFGLFLAQSQGWIQIPS